MIIPRLRIGTREYLPVYIRDTDRYSHTLLIGKSGTGKSSLIANWWKQDSMFKAAKVLIEPSGQLAMDAYSLCRGKAEYCSVDNPVSINPMEAPYDPNTISDIICESINQVISVTTPNQALTANMRAILDEAIKWCLKRERKSLIHVQDYIRNMKDPGSKVTRDGLVARLSYLLSDERIRPILCGTDAIEWGDFVRKRNTLIFDGFGMSRDKMVFLGSVIAQGIKNYFRFQKQDKYWPLVIYVDECQLFINENYFDILKEGRKYKISCTLATQDLALIGERMTRVMLNVGTIISFRASHREASLVARELGIDTHDIQFLDKYMVAYQTPSDRGIAKAQRPPIVKQIPIRKINRFIHNRMDRKPQWFKLQPYQPLDDSEHQEAVFADAQRQGVETPRSSNDGR